MDAREILALTQKAKGPLHSNAKGLCRDERRASEEIILNQCKYGFGQLSGVRWVWEHGAN